MQVNLFCKYVCKYSFRKRDAIIPIKYFGFDNMGAWKLSGEGSPRFLLKQDLKPRFHYLKDYQIVKNRGFYFSCFANSTIFHSMIP